MDPKRLKAWFFSSSAMVAAAASLAKKQAELGTVNNVTLPQIYYRIGKRLIDSGNLPADLTPHRDRIRQLEAAIAAKPKEPTREVATGFAAKAKHLAQRAAASTAKATADAASRLKIQAAYVALGRAVIDRCGAHSLPEDLREQHETAIHKRDILSGEIQTLHQAGGNRWATPGRLVLVGGVLCLMLGFVGLRAAGRWVFEGSKQVRVLKAPSTESLDTADAVSAASRKPSSLNRTASDAVVNAVLGPTSQHYTLFGYKDVVLGQTFKEVDSKWPLGWSEPGGPYRYIASEGNAPKTFMFDANDRLVYYEVYYEGGSKDYLPELKAIFGGRGKAIDNTTDLYTFPATLVFVQFQKLVSVLFTREVTVIYALDRSYVERLLRATAEARWEACRWIQSAAQSLKNGDVGAESLPSLKGCRNVPINGETYKAVAACDTSVEQEMDAAAEPSLNRKGQVAHVATGTLQLNPFEPEVTFDFRLYTPSRVDICLKQSATEGGEASPAYAVDCLPCVWLLRAELTAFMLHAHLPSSDGVFRLIRRGGSGAYEWEHQDAEGDRWTVQCGENDVVRIVYKPRKRL